MIRALRRIADAAVLASLAMLGWQAYQPIHDTPSRVREITLWTEGAGDGVKPRGLEAALPDATNAPAGAVPAPDTAYLRRTFPMLERVWIEGDGVDATSAAALRGRGVVWRRPAVRETVPRLIHVAADRILAPGDRLIVQGHIAGLPSNGTIAVSLEGPDGGKETTTLRASPAGDAVFSLTSGQAAIVPGAFEWKLHLGPAGEPLMLGAWVTSPDLPRVLILQATPTVEGGRLQRWLSGTGAAVTMRTRVSAEHHRFVSANGSPGEFPRLDSSVLAAFDAVVAFKRALPELAPDERGALAAAIEGMGLGLLVVAGIEAGATDSEFSPWEPRPDNRDEAEKDPRLDRLRLPDGRELAEPVLVPPAGLETAAPGRWLVHDARGGILGAAAPRGRGRQARTLITDTWRWLQGGHPETYAAYWSVLLSNVARPTMPAGGAWRLEAGTAPLFPGEPVRLAWIGAPDHPLPVATVRGPPETAGGPAPLILTRDPRDPNRAMAVYFPTQPGWHEVQAHSSGATLAFHVQPAGALPGVRAARRHAATAALEADKSESAEPPTGAAPPVPEPASGASFALLLAGLCVWWWERRR